LGLWAGCFDLSWYVSRRFDSSPHRLPPSSETLLDLSLIGYQNKSKDTLVLTMEERLLSVPLPLFSAIDDTGALVAALLHVAPGQKLLGVREWLSIRDVVNILAQVLGKIVKFVEASEGFVTGDTDLDKDNMDMIGFCVELGYDGGKVDKSIVKPTDLDMPVQLGSVKEWCRKQDWDSILDIE